MNKKETPKKKIEITIGSDPEYAYFIRPFGELIRAHTLAEESMIGSYNNMGGVIGCDGGGGESLVAEMRPQANVTPLGHAEAIGVLIGTLFEEFAKHGHVIGASTVAYGHAIGGHIHIGNPELARNQQARLALVTNLDYWLAPTLTPLWHWVTTNRRTSGQYGTLSDHRQTNWGIEYRTLPSWLFSKPVTEGVLCLAYGIAKATLLGKAKIRNSVKDRTWSRRVCYYIEGNKNKILERRLLALRKLVEPHLTPEELLAVDKLFKAIKNPTHNYNIFSGWGLVQTAPERKLFPGWMKEHCDDLIRRLADHIPNSGKVVSVKWVKNIMTASSGLPEYLRSNPFFIGNPSDQDMLAKTWIAISVERIKHIKKDRARDLKELIEHRDKLMEKIVALNSDLNLFDLFLADWLRGTDKYLLPRKEKLMELIRIRGTGSILADYRNFLRKEEAMAGDITEQNITEGLATATGVSVSSGRVYPFPLGVSTDAVWSLRDPQQELGRVSEPTPVDITPEERALQLRLRDIQRLAQSQSLTDQAIANIRREQMNVQNEIERLQAMRILSEPMQIEESEEVEF